MSRQVRRSAGQASQEAGFTLIELLISITILGILMAAVSAAMMVGLSTNASTGTRLDESRDEQFTAAYFSADAQGAQTIRPGGAGISPTCDFPGGGGTVVVEFVGQDFSDTATLTPRTVSYLLRRSADGRTSELHRLVCTGGAPEDTTLARNLTIDDWDAGCIFTPPPVSACVGVRMTLTSGSLKDYTLTAYKRTT